ncbi:RNase H domain-containing protein [Trichonephila clavipes]|nr:RNase H domain-containing protein [Trichonephila clavipes]
MIWNPGQVTRTTPEMAPLSILPDHMNESLKRFNVQRPPLQCGSLAAPGDPTRMKHGLEEVLNEQDFGDLWILSDSRSSLQHLYNWITVGDKLASPYFKDLRKYQSPMMFISSGFHPMVKSEILKEWWTPPNHHWYESKHPGFSFLLKCDRTSQTAISRLKSGHKESFLLWRQEDFCSLRQVQVSASLPSSHLGLLGISEGGPFSSPLLVLDFLRVNGLMGLA